MSLRRRQVFLNGVNIVLCGNAEKFRGAAIAWGTKVEKDHALVSLPKHAAVTDCVCHSQVFTISVLASNQSAVARQYGGGMQSDRQAIDLDDLDFALWKVPVVRDATAQLLCDVRHTVDIKDQVLVIGEISEIVVLDHLEPLVYDHSHYFPT